MEIKDLIKRFEVFDGGYRREEVDEAISRKEEITPYLIEILEKVKNNYLEYIENDDYFGHFYAFYLLSYFNETNAHRIIVDILSLPDDFTYKLFGDVFLESTSSALIQTCSGDLTYIKELALNKNANEYSRSSALTAISYGVVRGYISRENALTFFKEFLENRHSEPYCFAYDTALIEIENLCPIGFLDLIKECHDDDYSEESYEIRQYEKSVEKGIETCLEELKEDDAQWEINDVHAKMSWWECFEEAEKEKALLDLIKKLEKENYKKKREEEKKKDEIKRIKRKMEKTSKKKNRKKK